jgi:glutamine cyclotransferase
VSSRRDRGHTQGLIFLDGVFFESTGLHGRSTLRKVQPETGGSFNRERSTPSILQKV